MAIHSWTLSYEKVPRSSWSEELLLLEQSALQAAQNAYAPYSNFRVGVSLLLEDGTIWQGNNQENAAYPSGLCAERVALFSIGALKPQVAIRKMMLLALDSRGNMVERISPCGACRQVMIEVAQRQESPFEVLMVSPLGAIVIKDCTQLLPFSFEKKNMDPNKKGRKIQ